MEAKELMINDWYKNSANECCKVVKNFGDIVWGEGNDVADSTDNPLSIPLTEEILEKNHFKWIGIWESWGIFAENGGLIMLSKVDDSFCLYGTTIFCSYIHELQHILRLAGLSELADNFKV